jgi:anti-sigma-K factor RskA
MSQPPDRSPPPGERDMLAGEYVMGLVEGSERASFEHRLEQDPELARAVESWRVHLAPIDATAPAIPPSAGLWPRIEAGILAIAQSAQAGVEPALRQGQAPARLAESAARQAETAGSRFADWWNSLFVWRGAALAGALAAIILAVSLVGALDRAKRQPVLVAVLLTETSVAAAVVNTFADGRVEMVPLHDIPVPEGKALEVWTLWDRAVGPRSVGLMQRARTGPLRLDQLPLGKDQLFEITIENATGSPTGRPTGPVIAKGTTSQAL